MLASLHIENVAVIKRLDIDFDSGFTAFTGETGAGKSIIIDSIRLLLGGKADRELIRHGEDVALATALFSDIDPHTAEKLRELDVEVDENRELTIFRSMSRDGRSKAKINSQSVSASKLAEIGKYLIAIHGQHDAMTLLDSEHHIEYLDSYANLGDKVAEYNQVYTRLNSFKNKLKQENEKAKTNEYRMKELSKTVKELSELNIKPGEYAKLQSDRVMLRNAEKMVKNINIIYRTLYKSEKAPGCNTLIDLAVGAFEKLEPYSQECGGYIERLRAISLELEEIANFAHSMSAASYEDPAAALDIIESRLVAIERAMRKYGDSEEELIECLGVAQKELANIENSGKRQEEYKKELVRLSGIAFKLGDEIHGKRCEAAKELEEKLACELRFLDLEKARFKISIRESRLSSGGVKLLPSGYDEVEFLISANVGEEPKSIAKIASGGELSRIMMSLRTVFADKDKIQAMIFDEIDTGVSGKTSEKIGIKLKQIGKAGQQVFSVTHSAQVAANADNHLKIRKHEVGGRTETVVEKLSREERIEELSRIMGGVVITENIRKSAEEMLG